jgi:integrase
MLPEGTELTNTSSPSLPIKLPFSQADRPSNPYIQAATRDNTRKAYQSDVAHFTQWGGLLPSSPEIITRYLQAFAALLNPRTLTRRLTALKHWHAYQGFADPTLHPAVRKTMIGIFNVHGQPKNKAPAINLEQLTQMATFMKQQNTLAMWRNNALLQVGFFGAFRRSELVALQFEQITFVPEGMDILIPRSKTDPSGAGQQCAIPYGDQELCPVTALKTWCEKALITSGFIFRGLERDQHLRSSPLLGKSVSTIIKKIARECQLQNAENFSSHSLRRGFATTASRKGAPFVSIMRHGRWRHEGTVLGYIEEGQRFEANAAKIIFQKEAENKERS